MPRAKYTITQEDRLAAWAHISKKLDDPDYPASKSIQAEAEFREIRTNKTCHNPINTWAEKYLNKAEWTLLKNSIRAYRSRSSNEKKKSITLDQEAWKILSTVSDHEGVTLSQTIKAHLSKEYTKVLNTKIK